ncbi:hypothetical protein [Azospirillum cavernae]|uniref:hypothetical protein n=1 Tax=Azospirillum cavernae TaxID=2320860 RepID=UPI0018F7CD13|nr:hypothetical protein [Azospirillum cavernae]
MFENAIASIRMGIEDFRQQDHDRDISAVRNLYAGTLLLAKEALVRAAPKADPALVIGAKIKPVPDGAGGIAMRQSGHTTIDFQEIGERARTFGIPLDPGALNALNKIRNDIEHHYTSESVTAIRAAISKGFPVIDSLFRHLDENPVKLLGEVWKTMLKTKEDYDQDLSDHVATMRMNRIPSTADLEQIGIEPDEFLDAFRANAIDRMTAAVTLDASGVVTIDGWQFQNDPSVDWYTITP